MDNHAGSNESALSLRWKETILVVDDDAITGKMISLLLREQGYTVLTAANGTDALRAAEDDEKRAIHLLLTDVNMPMMLSTELAEYMRTARPGLKALLVSGDPDDEAVRDYVRAAGAEFLSKPFRQDELILKVHEMIGG